MTSSENATEGFSSLLLEDLESPANASLEDAEGLNRAYAEMGLHSGDAAPLVEEYSISKLNDRMEGYAVLHAAADAISAPVAPARNLSATTEGDLSFQSHQALPSSISSSGLSSHANEDFSSSGQLSLSEAEHMSLGALSLSEEVKSGSSLASGQQSISALISRSFSLVERNRGKNQLNYQFDICGVPRNPICFDSRYPLRFFAIDFLAGPDFFDKLIQPKHRENQEYADMRLESESASFSYGGMIRFSAVFQNGLALRTGIAANQINERFTYKDPNATIRRVVNVLIDTIINAPMDTTFIFDTLSVVETGTRVREVHNRYQMIDIPFLIGAEFHNGNWTFTSSVGVMINVAFAKSGEILLDNGDPFLFNNQESADKIFRSSLGLSFTGSFGVGYRISPQYSILVEPRVKYQLRPLTLEAYSLNQNYFIFGLHAGLRYKFK